MTQPSWVALQGMAHSFIELCNPLWHNKTMIHEGRKGRFSFQAEIRATPNNVQAAIQLHSIEHANKVMLKILQARLQQYLTRECPDVQVGFQRGKGTGDQIANICCIMKKAREFQKKLYFCFIGYAKVFDCVDYNKLWEIFKEMGVPDHFTCSPEKPICRSRSNS